VLTLTGLVLAAGGHALAGSGRRPPRAIAFLRSFAIVNLAFAEGWVNVLRGRQITAWRPGEAALDGSSRPPSPIRD
jgi:hypothetical protein